MSEPLHEHIAVRAYFLHEHEQDMGLPDLGPWHYWFHAECFERIEMHPVQRERRRHERRAE